MTITEAKQIPLHLLIEYLGGRYSGQGRNDERWYYSPFRPGEKTASFKMNSKTNRWYDFGHVSSYKDQKSGGDILDLWCDFYNLGRKSGLKEALEKLARFSNIPNSTNYQSTFATKPITKNDETSQFEILKIHPTIFYKGLLHELKRRRISLDLANVYLKQAYLLDTKTNKRYSGFIFENCKGGYEISIPNPIKGNCIKRSTKPKALSFIYTHQKENALDIFEGFWDFLSWLEMNKLQQTTHHALILNSLSFCNDAAEIIIANKDVISNISLFMDNDIAGEKATYLLLETLEPFNFKIGTKECVYKDYKDLNEYWKNLSLKQLIL